MMSVCLFCTQSILAFKCKDDLALSLTGAMNEIHAGLQSSCSAGDSMQCACCSLHNSVMSARYPLP